MKKKDLKILAIKIAKAENIIANSNDEYKIRQAKNEILYLSNQINTFEDMLLIDEIVQEILKKKLDK